jgi:hypothetical protein
MATHGGYEAPMGDSPLARLLHMCVRTVCDHVGELRERLGDRARLVTQRDLLADDAPKLAPQAIHRSIGCFDGVPAGRVRREQPAVDVDARVGDPAQAGLARIRAAERQPAAQDRTAGVPLQRRHELACRGGVSGREVRRRMELDGVRRGLRWTVLAGGPGIEQEAKLVRKLRKGIGELLLADRLAQRGEHGTRVPPRLVGCDGLVVNDPALELDERKPPAGALAPRVTAPERPCELVGQQRGEVVHPTARQALAEGVEHGVRSEAGDIRVKPAVGGDEPGEPVVFHSHRPCR